MYSQKIVKVGNSLAIIIPIQACREWGLSRGQYILLRINGDGDIVVSPFDPEKSPWLKAFGEERGIIRN